MRSIKVCINLVKRGLPITDEESVALNDWLDKKKRSQNRFYRYIIIAAFLVFAGALFLPSFAFAYNERHYQTLWCDEAIGKAEVVMIDRTRVDCLTDEYAIEFNFAKK